MCPLGLALMHPAAETLKHYSQMGCPTHTGRDWTPEQIREAVHRGSHKSALTPEAIAHFKEVVDVKIACSQAKVLRWIDLRDNPPRQLKISPISAIPHKSKEFRWILDLSFALRLSDGNTLPSVNESTKKTAPRNAVSQMGHTLSRIIHAFAEADPDAKILMAKFDIKDCFWRLDCKEGEEYNFSYVLPQPEDTPSRSRHGIKFREFESIIAKVRHAFRVLPEGRGLLSPCNAILCAKPKIVFLQNNPNLREAICCICTLLRESTEPPTNS
jgi:hypothetical protein